MNEKQMNENLVMILNEHRHEQIQTEQALKEIRQVFALFLEGTGMSGGDKLIEKLRQP